MEECQTLLGTIMEKNIPPAKEPHIGKENVPLKERLQNKKLIKERTALG